MMNIRKCNECQQEKIRTEEFWSKNSRSADGLSYICKVCNREISKQHRLKQKIKNENIDNILNEGKKICNVCKCEKEIDTAFPPEKPEIVYCEKCYQQSVI